MFMQFCKSVSSYSASLLLLLSPPFVTIASGLPALLWTFEIRLSTGGNPRDRDGIRNEQDIRWIQLEAIQKG